MLKALLLAGTAMMALLPPPADAGTARTISITLPEAESAQAALDHAKLEILELVKNPDMTVPLFQQMSAEIIQNFIEERTHYYLSLRAKEVLQAHAEARRPGLWEGRNTDDATIQSDAALFAGWEVVEYDANLVKQLANGENHYTVRKLDNGAGVELYVWVRSPKHDSFRGRARLTMQVETTFQMRESEAQMRARAEATELMTFLLEAV